MKCFSLGESVSSALEVFWFIAQAHTFFRIISLMRVNRLETSTASSKYLHKQIASPGLMHETGCSGLVHWDDPEGWDEEGGGREDQDGEHMYIHG